MKVINCIDVNSALYFGIQKMVAEGEPLSSRAGDTLEIPSPVATTYMKPWQRVLINKKRDANPFFHLMEALWILAGRDDVKFLTEFNSRMGEYSDDSVIFNAPYGYRLREYFADHGNCNVDQLEAIIAILKKDPNSRQAVAQIWDVHDIEKDTKDKACNMSIVFRIRQDKLCMIVYNRSNDMVWGAYGANVVQFSMIQEYVAAHLGLPMGEYTQVSNSYHVYTSGAGGEVWDRLKNTDGYDIDPYSQVNNIMNIGDDGYKNFETDINRFFNAYDNYGIESMPEYTCWYPYFGQLVIPMLYVWNTHKKHGATEALNYINWIQADDWRVACKHWLQKRVK